MPQSSVFRATRVFRLAFAGALLLLAAIGVVSWHSLDEAVAANRIQVHTHEVLLTIESLERALIEAESAQRGFVIAGDQAGAEFHARFERSLTAVNERLLSLRVLTRDNPEQQQRLDTLNPIVAERIQYLHQIEEIRAEHGFSEAQQQVIRGLSRQSMDRAQAAINVLRTVEQALLRERSARVEQDEQASSRLIVSGSIVAVAVAALTAFFALRNMQALAVQERLQARLADLGVVLREGQDPVALGRLMLDHLVPLAGAQIGVLYRVGDDGIAQQLAAWGVHGQAPGRVAPGDGLVGEALRTKQLLRATTLPAGYLAVASGSGSGQPATVLVVPLVYRDRVEGLLELGRFGPSGEGIEEFLARAAEPLAVALAGARALARITELLAVSRAQGEELRVQQEELTQINADLARQASQLTLASDYKSRFLSNMSHELRTPLNSLLILSRQLADNPQGNLNEQQVRYARTINASGRDLLALIEGVLDLAKIESGTVTLQPDELRLTELCDSLDRTIRPLAEQKGLAFAVRIASDLPEVIRLDGKRLRQVLVNLLGNAVKFTPGAPGHRGEVSLDCSLDPSPAGGVLLMAVRDNGAGIPLAQQERIFAPFQQGEGTVGGTGLGLAIGRDLARLLGGDLTLVSEPGRGSTFTVRLPLAGLVVDALAQLPAKAAPAPAAPAAPAEAVAADVPWAPAAEAEPPRPDVRVALLVEDDQRLVEELSAIARSHGFQAVVRPADVQTHTTARDLDPEAVSIDLRPPGEGWQVLDRLKHDPQTSHVPVQVVAPPADFARALRSGAHSVVPPDAGSDMLATSFAELIAFAGRRRTLLVVEDDQTQREAIVAAVVGPDIAVLEAADGPAALAAFGAGRIDCVVLDLGLPGMSGQRLIEALAADPSHRLVPIVIYTARDLTREDEQRLRRSSAAIVLKTATSLDRLVAETALLLHRRQEVLPPPVRERLAVSARGDEQLAGRTVLVADDDLRNVFALTSVLERHGMTVVAAENGRQALAQLEVVAEIELVLMDVMMPEMDGYQAMAAIRAHPMWADLPIIALTAKAMPGERERCLAAGASDYLTKPVDTDRLLSMLRVRLC